MAEGVTIGIPAYEAEAFIERALQSAFSPSWPNLEVVISIDKGNDDTAGVARRFPGLRVIGQPQRLGWIANSNFVLAQARTRYAMILPHDDELTPDYVIAAMEELQSNPAAVVAYSDIAMTSVESTPIGQLSVTGSFHERMAYVLANQFMAIAYRGVLDMDRVRDLPIPPALGGFAADTLWFTRLACRGELLRVPGVRYIKYNPPNSAHRKWTISDAVERQEMWAVHCSEMLQVLLEDAPKPLDFTPELQRAWSRRVLEVSPWPASGDSGYDLSRPLHPQVAAVVERVLARQVPYRWMAGRAN